MKKPTTKRRRPSVPRCKKCQCSECKERRRREEQADMIRESRAIQRQLETERDALRSQLEEAEEQTRHVMKDLVFERTERVVAETRLRAARGRIGQLEGALLDYCRHGEYCTLSQAIPAEDEDKHHCTCGLSAALAPAPGTAPTREEASIWETRERVKAAHAPEPRVDPFDMPGKGDWE